MTCYRPKRGFRFAFSSALSKVALAATIAASAQSSASPFASSAFEICKQLENSKPSQDDRGVSAWINRIGFLYEELPSMNSSPQIIVVGSAIRISQTHILTTSHTFKYRAAVTRHRVMFGCTNAVKTEMDAMKLLRVYTVSDHHMTSSPKEHLDYALLAINPSFTNSHEEGHAAPKAADGFVCTPKAGAHVFVAGYTAINRRESIEEPRRLAVVTREKLRDLRRPHFFKTAGTMWLIDYKAKDIHDGFSGGAVFTEDGCLLGMHQRRLSKVERESFTKWDPYISLYYPECRKARIEKGKRKDDLDDQCLPGQSIWLGDIAVDAQRKRGADLLRDAPPLHHLANSVLRQRNYGYGRQAASGIARTSSPPSLGQPQGTNAGEPASSSPSTGQPEGTNGGDAATASPTTGQPAGTN